jgi:hypothetical protein
MEKKKLEEKVFELVSYMVISARNLLDEPKEYGPFRLVDAVSRLIEILHHMDIGSERLRKIKTQIDAGKDSMMGEEKEFHAFLDRLVSSLIEEIEAMR